MITKPEQRDLAVACVTCIKTYIGYLCIIFVMTGCSDRQVQQDVQTWQLVYQHDFNGQPITGRVEDLVNALKRGSPIRVSWGGTVAGDTSWIHFAEPVFTAVMSDTAVVVQFPLSFIQTDYVDAEGAFLQTDPPTGWRALMSTSGKYHQFHYDLSTGEISRIMYARTNMSWFALAPLLDNRPLPNLIPENAFRLDSLINK
ncbi:MAG TPA: hypothetical protein VKP65_18520 [Rhodothermales bacterium]|nr:hypothetical protein [Rhodothermales bacterium]